MDNVTRSVPAEDAFGRPRPLVVGESADGTRLVLLTGPGESVLIDPEHVELLISDLRELRSGLFTRNAPPRPGAWR